MQPIDSILRRAAAALVGLALSVSAATARDRQDAPADATQAHDAQLLQRDLQRSRLERAERERSARADAGRQRETAIARVEQLQQLEREFRQPHRSTAGAFAAPLQAAAYVAPADDRPLPAHAPGWAAYGLICASHPYAGHPGHWGVHPVGRWQPRIDRRLAPLQAFHAGRLACPQRPLVQRHWRHVGVSVHLR